MLFANFFDFFIPQHATTLSDFVLITAFWLARVGVFAVVLLDFEGGSTSTVLGEVVGASIAVVQATRWALVRLSLLVLLAVSHSHLELFGVLTSGKASNARHFAYLVVDFVNILVAFKLFNGSHERNLTHDNDFFEQEIDETIFQFLVVVCEVLLDQRKWLNLIDWFFLSYHD